MNGSTSPIPPTTVAGDSGRDEIAATAVNGHRTSDATAETADKRPKPSPTRNKRDAIPRSPNGEDAVAQRDQAVANADDNGGDSEAETLIDSPVKKMEADKQNTPVKLERPLKHRIGSLPVPNGGDEDDDSAAVSPAPSTVPSVERTLNDGARGDEVDRKDDASDNDDNSESLSSPRSASPSRGSSPERAESERPEHTQPGAHSPNPRKRKHRASSVSLPNKRPSMDAPRRRLRGLHSEELGAIDRSPSPKLRSQHRRAVSTQSALMDGATESASRKRKSTNQGSVKDNKLARTAWEESDASSETTSHGQSDHKRRSRGVGRSTSTPGRPPGREHKRHVNKYGFTRLAEACEDGNLDLVKEWREKDPDQLELAEFAGNKPLQIAALKGNVEVVDYLIDQGCQIDCANVDKDTPLIDAAENGHLDVVKSLLRAGVDPLRQNLKGQQALDAVTDDTEDADEIRVALRKAIEAWNSNGAKQRREEEEERRHRAGPTKETFFMARTYENLMYLVQINDRTGVQEFLDARVPVDNAIIGAAAKTGDVYLVNMLLAEVPEKKRSQKPEKRVLSVLGTSHFEMVQFMTELEDFNPHYFNRQGKSWPEIAEERRGPNWRQEKELFQRLLDKTILSKERRSSSPVSKRDGGKRRFVSRAAGEESEEEEVPRRKNGRKLMSKKEMRVAKGKAASDRSSDESDSELATGTEATEEGSMKPPESPATKRTPGRARTKSLSAQPLEQSPRTRRRSASFRAPSEQPLPTVEEDSKGPLDRQRDEEQRQAGEEAEAARKAEMQRKEEEEKQRAEADAAAKRAAEEEARKAEEERQAEAARREEEQRKVDEARRAEELRKRKEEERREAERVHREQVISSLPGTTSYVLKPDSSFGYNTATTSSYILRHFGPLQVLKYGAKNSTAPYPQGLDGTCWVVNIQAAPFIGKRGVELMLRHDVPGFQGSLADRWETMDMFRDDLGIIESFLIGLPQMSRDDSISRHHSGQVTLSFEERLQMMAKRIQAAANAKDRLRNGEAVLRYVRLDDVLQNLHPTLAKTPIEVRFDYLGSSADLPDGSLGEDFLDRVGPLLKRRPMPRTYINGTLIGNGPVSPRGSTPVTVVHQK